MVHGFRLRQKHRERPEREKSGISEISGIGEHERNRRMGVRKRQGGSGDKVETDKNATRQWLKNRQIVTVSLTLRGVLIKC